VIDLVADPGSVRTLAQQIRNRDLTARALVERCLARIDAVDDRVKAWIVVARDEALAEADACDADARAGKWRGPLHGTPFAVKDVIDVAHIPTRAGSRARADAPPAAMDATVVARLRARGAIMLGKVHTTEFAYFDPPPTRNPHDLARTPGGSSAGSAAAVASGTVPFALGTQTAGSVNRPAAFCGLGAFKPTTLALVGAGVVPFAPSFDTVGVIASTAADAAYVVEAIAPEPLHFNDNTNAPAGEVVFLSDALLDELREPAMSAAMAAFAQRLEAAGVTTRAAPSPVPFAAVLDLHATISRYELSRVNAGLLDVAHLLGDKLANDIREYQAITDADYTAALSALFAARERFWNTLPWPAVIAVPAAPGPAPLGDATGDHRILAVMTALGAPLASIPRDPCPDTGAPLGAVLGAPPGYDGALAAALEGLSI